MVGRGSLTLAQLFSWLVQASLNSMVYSWLQWASPDCFLPAPMPGRDQDNVKRWELG